ncbi:serine/threonine protein kinase [Mortierella claussenii]|nr:serine/threonine protein kinase [Mortierella claussenii]
MGSSTTVIGGEYLVLGKIGEGSFGEVFRATHIATGVDYAIKREPSNVPHPQLEHEAKMYGQLAGGLGIPKMHWFGKEGMYNAMVIDLLGPNLKQVRRENEKFPLSFVIELGVQMVSQLESIHKKGIVYRDVKPENFLLDADIVFPDAPASPTSPTAYHAGNANGASKGHGSPPKTATYPHQTMSFFNDTRRRQQHSIGAGSDSGGSVLSISPESPLMANYGKPHLSIVDFGLAAYYRDACGMEHSRRDDIESVGYMLLEFLIGALPWSGISARNSRQGWAKMREIKEDIELDELCDGLPKGFMSYIGYSRSLKFDEEPDYDYLRTILRSSAGRGAEAQTVRCHREPAVPQSRSLEHAPGGGGSGLPIHRGGGYGDPFKSKERSKGDNPLKDWRTRAQYSPPSHYDKDSKNPHLRYTPTSLWTTTPPDLARKDGQFGLEAQDVHDDLKDKIEWDIIAQPQEGGDRKGSLTWGADDVKVSCTAGRNRKCSWGEDDPNSRWGQEDDPYVESEQDEMPFLMGSFQDESAPIHHQHPKAPGAKAGNAALASLGRQFAPQDARFYSNDPPVGLMPRLGNGSGFIESLPHSQLHPHSQPQPIITPKGRSSHLHQQNKVHPLSLSKDTVLNANHMPPPLPPAVPLSPKSLSSSFSSLLNVRAGAHEEPGMERTQIPANKGFLPDRGAASSTAGADKSSKASTFGPGRGRKYSNPQSSYQEVRGRGWSVDHRPAAATGNGNGNGNGNGSENVNWVWNGGLEHSFNVSGTGKGRSGSENWQPRSSERTGRRRCHGTVEFFSDNTAGDHPGSQNPGHGSGQGSSFEPRTRQASTSGIGIQGPGHGSGCGQPALQSPKLGQSVHVQPHHNQSNVPLHSDQGQSRSQGYSGGTFGFQDHRRQPRSRSRKCSNSSLSSLTDHWAANGNSGNHKSKVGNGNGNGSTRIKSK